MYYVYEHVLDGTVFYVGMGTKYRPYDIWHRTNKWKQFVKDRVKDVQVNIIFSTDNKNIALQKETEHTLLRINEGYPLCQIRAGNTILSPNTVWNKGVPMTEEQKQKLSNTIKQKFNTPEMKQKFSNAQKGNHNKLGKKLTEEQKQKISERTKQGMKNIDIVPWNRGKTLTDEHKKKVSEGLKRYYEEKRRQLSDGKNK